MAMLGASSAQDQEQDQLLTNLVYRYYSNEQLAPHLEQEKLALILKQIKAIRAFAQEYMPQVQISDEEITILSMSIFTPHQTPEKGIVDTDRNYIEVKRALSRFYCISLLQQGSEGYAAFVENQPKDNEFIPTLQKEEFAELAKKYQSLDALTLDTLKVATLISSVPLTLEARKRADKIFGKNNYLVDTVEFAAKVFEDMDVARKVYPQVDYLLQRYPSEAQQALIKQNLQSAFAHHRHYRHMLYTEGSTNMFATLIAEVQQGKLSKEAYDFWVLYWNTNITGFQGNVQPKGSYYLTSNTHRAMCALESVLEALFDDNSLSASNLLSAYLTQRAGFLGLGDANNTGVKLNIKEQEFLAHIGAMMRFYNKEQGQLLSSSYLVIKDIIQDLRKDFYQTDDTMPTPTYAPALFANIKDALVKRYDEEKVFRASGRIKVKGLNMSAAKLKEMLASFETLVLCLPLYLSALQQYKKLRREKAISQDIPLSFKSFANPEWILALFDKSMFLDNVNILDLIDVTVSKEGDVGYQKKEDFEKRLQAQLTPLVDTPDLFAKQSAVLTSYASKTAATPITTTNVHTSEDKKKTGLNV